jgi:hypothetical protein
MARVTFYNAELLGSVGGTTYSRNKTGAIARARVKGTNPRTGSQVNQRSSVSNVSKTWQALDQAQKNRWTSFATTLYTPRAGRKTGVAYTGAQSYIGTNLILAAAREAQAVFTMKNGVTDVSITQSQFALNTSAPLLNSGTSLSDVTAAEHIYTVADVEANRLSNNDFEVNFSLNFATALPATTVKFLDFASSQDAGFCASLGSVKKYAGSTSAKSDVFYLGGSGQCTFVLATAASVLNCKLTLSSANNINKTNLAFENQYAELSIFQYNAQGTIAEIFRGDVQIGDGL